MKKIVIIIASIFILVFGLFKGLEYWLEAKFENIINTNPERQYDIEYEKFDLNSFFQGIRLSGLTIHPLNKESGTLITGKVRYAELSGFIWWKFLKDESVVIDQLSFIEPEFQIDIQKKLEQSEQDSTSKSKPAGIQNLFGDIISRVGLNSFQIVNASLSRTQDDSLILGQMYNMNLLASDINTGSVQFTHIIPFELKNLEVKVDSAFYRINDYTKAKLGSIDS